MSVSTGPKLLGFEGGICALDFLCSLLVLALSRIVLEPGSKRRQSAPKNGGDFSDNMQPGTKVPTGVILVKGAWSSASDSVTPVPEGGRVTNNVFSDQYFGMTYALPPGLDEKYKGPPPSDSGRYVLAQIRPADTFKGPARGSILITAQDMFFTPLPANNALELVNYSKDHLQADYKVELPPTPNQDRRSPLYLFCVLVSDSGAALVCSGHRNPLPRGGNRPNQPRHQTAGELGRGYE